MKIEFTSPLTHEKETLELYVSFYGDGTTALTSTYFDEEFQMYVPYGTFSVNLGDYHLEPKDKYHVFIKDYSEGKGNIDELEKYGIVKRDNTYFLADEDAVVKFGPFQSEAVHVEIIEPSLLDKIAAFSKVVDK